MRCPLPKDAFEIEVRILRLSAVRATDTLLAQVRVVSNADAAQRADIKSRLKDFIMPDTRRFTNWT